ncbi:hypothetical protein [Aurantibacillus circumpalustris]|uniref:hypothetical protein n=1 Tax=Aurantibacillus circumpalustris TaxID=3036359 RepID=UPI00295B2F1E|nr:hypothetical protein [Aurantibacillus circumpalustris]
MIKRLFFIFVSLLFLSQNSSAQHQYYKNVTPDITKQFNDSANRVSNLDANSLLRKQFDYVLKFYPKMRVKNILVKYNKSSSIARVKPKFASIFKLPGQRVYTVYFSKQTKTTLDSVLLDNLSFNPQIALIANQISVIEDLSTGGFFNFLGFYVKQLTIKGRKGVKEEAELKTIEVGLGYQLLELNKEYEQKLEINNWVSTKGYSNYFKHYRGQSMKPQRVLNFLNDFPIYVSNSYK